MARVCAKKVRAEKYPGYLWVLLLTAQRRSGMAEKLRRSVECSPMRTAAGAIPVTVSIGVAGLESSRIRRDSEDAPLDSADRCLHRSKQWAAIA